MQTIIQKFRTLCNTESDINEHLPTLYRYAKQCDSAIELGVRGCISSWAILAGILEKKGSSQPKRILMNDNRECDVQEIEDTVKQLNKDRIMVQMRVEWNNDLALSFEPGEMYDLVFIDTWHVYGQIKRELNKFAPICSKYIIMHDTTVDEVQGETIRNCGYNIQQAFNEATRLSVETGIPREEIMKGMWYGIQEFLAEHPEWYIKDRYFNNNGLTVLARR